ncbi:MAG TPA: hypothetical protein VHK27_13900 [Gammaproteobacteria bacterium]|nr:hypothetical protein [Gammaproteobacteria bacterium]
MKRITLILGVAAVMAAMMVTLTAPAMADNNRQENRQDRQENRQDNRFNNHHNWFDNDRDNVVIRYDPDSDFYSDDFDSFYPYWGWGFYPYWGSYDDCGFDWDGPVTPADCWD